MNHSMPLMYMESLLSSSSSSFSSTCSLQHVDSFNYQMVPDPLLENPFFMAQAGNNLEGFERDLFLPLPQLESTMSSFIGEYPGAENTCDSNASSDNLLNNTNSFSNVTGDFKNSGNMGDDSKIGDWDLEELLKDVWNFPLVDFQ